jgi:phosphatidylinositol-3-phosphatase
MRPITRIAARGIFAFALVASCLGATSPANAAHPPIKHVFTIVLENQELSVTFGPTGQLLWPYLARTLPLQGAFVPNYYGIGHNSLDNYIAMISGQSPNPATQDDCEDPSTMGDDGHF